MIHWGIEREWTMGGGQLFFSVYSNRPQTCSLPQLLQWLLGASPLTIASWPADEWRFPGPGGWFCCCAKTCRETQNICDDLSAREASMALSHIWYRYKNRFRNNFLQVNFQTADICYWHHILLLQIGHDTRDMITCQVVLLYFQVMTPETCVPLLKAPKSSSIDGGFH